MAIQVEHHVDSPAMHQNSTTIIERSIAGAAGGAVIGSFVGGPISAAVGAVAGAIANNGGSIRDAFKTWHSHTPSQSQPNEPKR